MTPTPTLNVTPGTIFHMDNIHALRGINSSTIDLIATDPPFNTGRNREAVGGKYPDQWLWDEKVHAPWLDQIRDLNRAVAEVIESAMHAHSKNLGAFLCFLAERLIECERILKETGSIYVHLDPTASHYVKGIMDAIFGAKNFRSELIWRRTGGRPKGCQHKPKTWGKSADYILHYGMEKAEGITPWRPLMPLEIEEVFPKIDEWGQRYKTIPFWCGPNMGPRPTLCFEWRGFRNPHRSGWRLSKENLEKEYQDGSIVIKGDRLERRLYLRNYKGWPHGNIWTDIDFPSGSERTGYPDQKPVALYERIIAASSNEGDLVLDPFCGCGTTLVAATNLGRQWIGMDRNDDAQEMILCNLADMKKAEVNQLRKKSQHTDPGWIDRLLAKHEAVFTTAPPERTDDLEEVKTPNLKKVYRHKDRTVFTPDTMKRMLYEQFGPQCWGCDFQAPAGARGIQYLELDHVRPKSESNINHFYNRALLCGPCNKEKSDRLQLNELRRRIYGSKKKAEAHPIDLEEAAAWTRQQEIDELIRREREKMPLFGGS